MLKSHIDELFKEAGLRTDFIAEKFEVSRFTISNWAAGRSFPNMETGFKLAAFLSRKLEREIKVDDLYTYVPDD